MDKEGVLRQEKQVLDTESALCRYGVVSFQGWRSHMEDEVVVIRDWGTVLGHGAADFIGVYDGHYGSHVSSFCKKYLHRQLLETANNNKSSPPSLEVIFKETFLRMDVLMRTLKGQTEMSQPELLNDLNAIAQWGEEDLEALVPASDLPIGGACVIAGLIFKDKVVIANAGDCRCVVVSRGGQATDLSKDHKPTLPAERERIYAAGGFVNAQGRVSGVFNMSRGLGDFVFKDKPELPPEKQLIVALPEVVELSISKDGDDDDEFMVFGSDGIWFPMEDQAESSQRLVDGVKSVMRMYPGIRLSEICWEHMESFVAPHKECLTGTDNMTMVLAQFKSSSAV